MSRRIVIPIFVVLMAVNFIVGGLGYYYLGQVDKSYAKLLSEGLPLLNSMQSATAEASRSYTLAIDLSQADTPEERLRLAKGIQAHLTVADRIYASPALREAVPAELLTDFDLLVASRQAWRHAAADYLSQVESAGLTAAARYTLHTQVYPALRNYLNRLDTFCDNFQEAAEKQHRFLLRSNSDNRSTLIRFAALPLLGLTGIAAVLAFAVLFNGKRTAPQAPASDSRSPYGSGVGPNSRRWIFPDLLHGITRAQKQAILRQNAKVIWLYGLPGSGKTALAEALEKQLFASGYFTCTVDGDGVRSGLNRDLGFTDEDRSENIRRVAEVAKMHVQDGLICIVAVITPRHSFRLLARSIIGREDFVDVFVSASVETCVKRDPKGLYSLNKTGQVQLLSGRDSMFEPPGLGENPIVINTEAGDLETCVAQLYRAVIRVCARPKGDAVQTTEQSRDHVARESVA